MFYYQCKRCNYIAKQKIDMKRHLEKQKKCIINNNEEKDDFQLREESLVKHFMDDELKSIIKKTKLNNSDKNSDKNKRIECHICNKVFHNKSNLNKHFKNNSCNLDKDNNEDNNENTETTENNDKVVVQHINNIQNIGVQNNVINININSLRGFDEDWNISNITKDMREKLLLSDKKFTNTLENILKNDDNLNIILKDKMTGLVYKIKNNEYEAMSVKDIFEETMYKIYKHLREFFQEIITDNQNDIRMNILENEIKEVDKKYNRYVKSLLISSDVNKCLSNIIDDKKTEAIKKFIKLTTDDDEDNNDEENNNDESNNNEDNDDVDAEDY